MHSILGRGGRRPAFRDEQGWKESPSSQHTSTTTQSPNFHAEPLFGTPSGSLQDILRSVHMVEGSAFVTVPKPSNGSQQQQQPDISQQVLPVPDPAARNVNVEVPVPVPAPVIDHDGLGKDQPSTLDLRRKHLQSCHTASTWDHSMRNDHVFEGYPHAHSGFAEISSTPLQQQQQQMNSSFKHIGTWTSTQATGPGDHNQQWSDLRGTSKTTTLLELPPDIDNGSCPASVWRERWSDSPRLPTSSDRQTSSSAAAAATAAAAQVDESTDGGSDPMDEKSSRRWSGTAGYCSSRNLFSERKRRKKMNDGLYSLRSLVPNISKMDKASIIGDAIKYVMELERQVKELEAEMEMDEQRQNKVKTSLEHLGSSSMGPADSHEVGDAPQTENDPDSNKNSSGTPVSKVDLKDQSNISLELSKMKSGMYSLRMFYQKQPGIFMHMTEAIESLDLNILNSHVSTCDGYVVHSLIAKMTSWDDTVLGDVENQILGLVRKFQ